MKKLISIFIGIIFLMSSYSFGHDQVIRDNIIPIENQVKEINGMKLFKTYLGQDYFKKIYDGTEWEEAFYYDDQGRVRKSTHSFFFAPDEGFFHRYYDPEGYCICDIIVSYGEYEIKRLFEREELVYADYIEYDESRLVQHIIRMGWPGAEIPTPSTFTNNLIFTTDDLMDICRSYGIDDMTKPTAMSGTMVRFVSPGIEETSFINSNGVRMFTEPSGCIITDHVLNVGCQIKVVEIVGEWFRVKTGATEGFIEGKHIEPIEKKIE